MTADGIGAALMKELDSLRNRIKVLNKAGLIIIDGGVGEGKTTLAVQCADYFQGAPIDLHKQLAMGGKDFITKAREAHGKNYDVLVYDEAGDFSKRGSLTKFNMHLNRFFETYRAYKMLVIVCLPDFNQLDNALFRNKIPRLLLHCAGRTQNAGIYQAYSLHRMGYLKFKMHKFPYHPHLAFKYCIPNFCENFRNLTARRAYQLAGVSTSSKLKSLDESVKRMENQLTVAEIGKKLGLNPGTVHRKLGELKIKPVGRLGNLKLYDDSCVQKIKNTLPEYYKTAKNYGSQRGLTS